MNLGRNCNESCDEHHDSRFNYIDLLKCAGSNMYYSFVVLKDERRSSRSSYLNLKKLNIQFHYLCFNIQRQYLPDLMKIMSNAIYLI